MDCNCSNTPLKTNDSSASMSIGIGSNGAIVGVSPALLPEPAPAVKADPAPVVNPYVAPVPIPAVKQVPKTIDNPVPSCCGQSNTNGSYVAGFNPIPDNFYNDVQPYQLPKIAAKSIAQFEV